MEETVVAFEFDEELLQLEIEKTRNRPTKVMLG